MEMRPALPVRPIHKEMRRGGALSTTIIQNHTKDFPLTCRQTQVMVLAQTGATDRWIGYILGTTENTVGSQISKIRHKSGQRTRTGLVVWGYAVGALSPVEYDSRWLYPGIDDLVELDDRDVAILDLLTFGLAYQQIAEKLGLQYGTIKNRMQRLLGKFGAQNAAHLALIAHMQLR